MQPVLSDDYVSVPEAAADLKVTSSTVRRWIASGDLPAYRVGKRRIVLKRSDIMTLIAPARRHTDIGGSVAKHERQPNLALSDQDKARARAAVEAAKKLQAELLARRGGRQFPPSWELLNDVRDLRGRQQ